MNTRTWFVNTRNDLQILENDSLILENVYDPSRGRMVLPMAKPDGNHPPNRGDAFHRITPTGMSYLFDYTEPPPQWYHSIVLADHIKPLPVTDLQERQSAILDEVLFSERILALEINKYILALKSRKHILAMKSENICLCQKRNTIWPGQEKYKPRPSPARISNGPPLNMRVTDSFDRLVWLHMNDK